MGKQSEAVPFGEVKSPSIPSATRSSVRLQRTTISCRPIAHQDMIDSECVTNCRRHFGPHEHAPAALVRHPPGRLPARTSALHIMASTPATSASVVSPRAARRRDPRARMFGLARRIPPILLVALALARCPTAVAGETLRARGVDARATSRWSVDEAWRGRVSARWVDAERRVGPVDSGSEEASGPGAGKKPDERPPIFARDVEESNVSSALESPRREGRKLAAASSTSAKSIVTGYSNTFAIMDDGSVMCWGSNSNGALGVGSSGGKSYTPVGPIDLGAGHTAKMVSAGAYHTCAILDDDTLKCWGNNFAASWGTATPRAETAPRRRRW